MRLTFIGTDSGGGQCPAVYATDRQTAVIQGKRITDAQALADLAGTYGGLPADETAVEVKFDLLVRWLPTAVRAVLDDGGEAADSLRALLGDVLREPIPAPID